MPSIKSPKVRQTKSRKIASVVLAEKQKRELEAARKNVDQGGYLGLKVMFAKHGLK